MIAATVRGDGLQTVSTVASLPSPPQVVAMQTDGRVITGVVDARTDGDTLWLRRDEPALSLVVSVAWAEIAAVELDGEPIGVDQLAEQADHLASRRSVMDVWATASSAKPPEAPSANLNRDGPDSRTAVAALRVDACVANWDADAQTDGLAIRVAPVDVAGRLVPVRGELTVRLLGASQTSRHRRDYGQLAQWSTPVASADFAGGAAFYQMPLPSLQPEVDTDVGTLGRLHVRLGVFGGGAFEATTPVRLRAFDPLGDELQQLTGRRFFPQERPAVRRTPVPVGDGLFFSAPVGP